MVSGLSRGSRCAARAAPPRIPVRLVGHSMGGNVAAPCGAGRSACARSSISRVSGCRAPGREAPGSPRKWLDQVKAVPPLKDYDSFEQLASIIRYRYPRFGEARSASSRRSGRSSRRTAGCICSATRAIAGSIPSVPARGGRGVLARHPRARAHDARGAVRLSSAPRRRWRRREDSLDHLRCRDRAHRGRGTYAAHRESRTVAARVERFLSGR